MRKEQKRKYCEDCHDNFYHGFAVNGCWSFKDAKVVWKDIYYRLSAVKPTKVRTLDCFHIDRGRFR